MSIESRNEHGGVSMRHARCERGDIHEYSLAIDEGLVLRWGDFVIHEEGIGLCQQINACVLLDGCNMHCGFCTSAGKSNFTQLSVHDLLRQVDVARNRQTLTKDAHIPWQVSFQGEGEPAANQDNFFAALKMLSSRTDLPRSVLVSTTGHGHDTFMPRLAQIAADFPPHTVKLQVSATSADPQTRKKLMPDSPPLAESLASASLFTQATGTPFKLNFPIIAGKTDTEEHVEHIATLTKGLSCIVKISTLNDVRSFHAPDLRVLHDMRRRLEERGVRCQLFVADASKELAVNCGTVTAAHTQDVRKNLFPLGVIP